MAVKDGAPWMFITFLYLVQLTMACRPSPLTVWNMHVYILLSFGVGVSEEALDIGCMRLHYILLT